MMTLRELRVWHWRRVLGNRRAAQNAMKRNEKYKAEFGCDSLTNTKNAKSYTRIADFHVGCVQALNDAVLVEFNNDNEWTTAEQDLANGIGR